MSGFFRHCGRRPDSHLKTHSIFESAATIAFNTLHIDDNIFISFSHFNFLLNCNHLLKMCCCKGNTLFLLAFFCLILTMRRQTDISACEIHFSVVIWIQSVTDANYILAPNLPLSLFNSVQSTWRPLLHRFVGVAMTTQSLCTHISTYKRQRGAPWHYLHRHHQGHSQQSFSQRLQPSCP